MITQRQINAAKKNARLHGFSQEISDDLARQFVRWFSDNQPVLISEFDAASVGLTGAADNGIEQQVQWWQESL